ncbi:glyoxalase [Coccidioides immitis RS]|uniref:Glyoxalase n=7 Tax=Coccidioides TaxID=5500 RepID=J3KLF5_COCIM|nr:glyoxalase [Coccidioides immitis RS]XP_003070966.1 hypothetical protein CPC735_040850 [Coccidioides posadasii C735 delta SOWgp]EFW22423.1 conserved hypothetical protein [Coccidioides posadasii str. Silveira]KMM64033.1 hypothetical protein CPAG_00385 [Coccidioides posadasii RMSCC 3488]KMP10049.1 hypothetical protein CIRG_09282 [Coccidioides immitis RMSCC 2394]KMU81055.1 hypothetical protein CISG_02434 [Coccidioides immitis RMSCC 3703]KMU86560.1 hypothetical protein CIHG_04349 [Coccidioides |eukprot:XP_003070966.1 hypothetical protein CPC735_040850 [Coccidioides posadasii C735 delta SOWgp]
MGFSHMGFCVPQHKFDETVSFYLAALQPLGYKEMMRPVDNVVGLGVYYPDFWITGVKSDDNQDADEDSKQQKPLHVAFSTNSRELVHAFYDAALKAGAKCNGKPGPRPQYTRLYYASFVLDPVGNNIEAVCMWPAWTHWRYWFGTGVFGKSGTRTVEGTTGDQPPESS